MENREKRYNASEIRLLPDDKGDTYVEGYAMVFNSPSQDLGGFVEIIEPTALSEEIINGSDVFCYINHNENNGVLARRRYGVGSLQLTIDDKGLKYRFKLGKSYHHQQLSEYLERGEIFGSSFAFTVADDQWVKLEDGSYIRTIKRFEKLYDVSPVFEPAYLETEVALRSLEKIKTKELEQQKEKEKKAEELRNYFVELKKTYSYDN